ncbi:TPA: hypothetical protein GDO54_018648 [Pyxicephalus adspersus]|uniref:Uncharacterized protein n=1 Tax=Pyxicephalus adspersus TaxID=30357 RepID=A0AAV2ZJR1_PYXAD|nr:TPA: hypothetical protein GDO54_018648 [Pyxicephalus adspersus]
MFTSPQVNHCLAHMGQNNRLVLITAQPANFALFYLSHHGVRPVGLNRVLTWSLHKARNFPSPGLLVLGAANHYGYVGGR